MEASNRSTRPIDNINMLPDGMGVIAEGAGISPCILKTRTHVRQR